MMKTMKMKMKKRSTHWPVFLLKEIEEFKRQDVFTPTVTAAHPRPCSAGCWSDLVGQ